MNKVNMIFTNEFDSDVWVYNDAKNIDSKRFIVEYYVVIGRMNIKIGKQKR